MRTISCRCQRENSVGRDETCHRAQAGAAKTVTQDGQPAALGIGEAEGPASNLRTEGAVLFDQIGHGVGFALVEPRGHGEEQEAHRRQVNHARSIAQKPPCSGVSSVMGHYGVSFDLCTNATQACAESDR